MHVEHVASGWFGCGPAVLEQPRLAHDLIETGKQSLHQSDLHRTEGDVHRAMAQHPVDEGRTVPHGSGLERLDPGLQFGSIGRLTDPILKWINGDGGGCIIGNDQHPGPAAQRQRRPPGLS